MKGGVGGVERLRLLPEAQACSLWWMDGWDKSCIWANSLKDGSYKRGNKGKERDILEREAKRRRCIAWREADLIH